MVESRLLSSWAPGFSRWGIPVFVQRLTPPRSLAQLPSPGSLPPLVQDALLGIPFKRLSPVELAFRNEPELPFMAFSAMMRGRISLEATGTVIVAVYRFQAQRYKAVGAALLGQV